jgi:peptide/nickel transport system substrate-binding protein
MWSAGRFVFRGYQVGAEIRFERNPNYFRKDRPILGGTVIRIVPDVATTQAQLRTGQIDATGFAVMVTPKDVPSLKRDMPNATFTPFFRHVNEWLGFDLREAPFQDKRVRQAISMGINRDEFVTLSGEGLWSMPYGALKLWYFDPKRNEFPNARYYQYNPQEARALLRAAGYERIGPYDLIFYQDRYAEQRDYAALLQQQLRAIGVEVNLKPMPYAEFYSLAIVAGRWEKALAYGSNLASDDPDQIFTFFWTPGSPRLVAPGLDPLLRQDTELLSAIERQKRELDFNRRRELVREVVNIMADRMYNIPMVLPGAYHVHQGSVRNMNWIFSGALEYLDDPYKEQ